MRNYVTGPPSPSPSPLVRRRGGEEVDRAERGRGFRCCVARERGKRVEEGWPGEEGGPLQIT